MKTKQNFFTFIAIIFLTIAGALVLDSTTHLYKDQPEVKAVSEHPEYIPADYHNIGQPQSLLVLPDGNIWYIDPLNGRIVLITQAGEILRTVGRYGTAEGEFDGWVTGITRDTQGNLYVLTGGHVYKLDSNGGFIMTWDGSSGEQSFSNASSIYYDTFSNALVISDKDNSRIKKYTTSGAFISQFGAAGAGDGQFLDAQGVTTDSNGRIYVVDSQPNCRVEVFSPTGTFLFKFGSCGGGDGQFTVPVGIKIKANGEIVVASAHTHSLQEFDSSGNWIRTFSDQGDNAWQFLTPFAVDFDSAGNYYLIDHYHQAIQKYSSNRVFISGIRNSGFVGGKLTTPTSVAYDSVGNLYVLDNGAYNGRIQKFTNGGTYISTIVEPPTFGDEAYYMTIKNDEIYVADHTSFKKFDLTGTLLLNIGSEGTGNGQFIGARGIAVDSLGNIYVTDASNHRVQKFDSAGNYLLQWGSLGIGNGQFAVPSAAIVIDSADNIYVPDNQNNYEPDILQENTRIQVFNTSGVYQRTIGSFGEGDGQFIDIGGIVIDSSGQLHVSETNANNPKIQIFTTDGTYVGKYGKSGSGTEEYVEPRGLGLNPITNNISIVDSWGHRV
jgi:sugar lactone lactonase YvrE